MRLRLNPWRGSEWGWLLASGLLLGACQDRPTPDGPLPATRYQAGRAPALAEAGKSMAPSQPVPTLRAVVQHGRRETAAIVPSGSVDLDFVAYCQAQHRATARLVELILARSHQPALRDLADSVNREQRRDARQLARLAAQLPAGLAAQESAGQYAAFRDGVRALLDSAGRQPLPSTAATDAVLTRCLAARLRPGLLLVQEEIAHGSSRPLITLAHHLLHDQRRFLRQLPVTAASDTLLFIP